MSTSRFKFVSIRIRKRAAIAMVVAGHLGLGGVVALDALPFVTRSALAATAVSSHLAGLKAPDAGPLGDYVWNARKAMQPFIDGAFANEFGPGGYYDVMQNQIDAAKKAAEACDRAAYDAAMAKINAFASTIDGLIANGQKTMNGLVTPGSIANTVSDVRKPFDRRARSLRRGKAKAQKAVDAAAKAHHIGLAVLPGLAESNSLPDDIEGPWNEVKSYDEALFQLGEMTRPLDAHLRDYREFHKKGMAVLKALKQWRSELQAARAGIPPFPENCGGTANNDTFIGLGGNFSIGAGGNVSRVDANSAFGIGTVVVGGGEVFGALVGRWVNRAGFDVDGEFDLADRGILLGPQSHAKATFGFSYASGSATSSGGATVGAGGVTQAGLTFLTPDGGLGTGVSSAVAGDRLAATVKISNDWMLGYVGYCESFAPRGPGGPEFHIGGAFTFEQFDQDFSGRADILRAGVSLAGQDTRGTTTDKYYGYEFNAGVTLPVTERFSAGIEGYVTPSYHTGKASLSQFTDFGAGVTQQLEFSNDNFKVSAGVRTNLQYDFTPTLSLKVSYEYSRLAGVSEVHVPANPNEQPAFFDSGPVDRHFGRIELTWTPSGGN